MNRDEKTAVIAELTDELKNAEAIFAIDYRGISVPQAAELRSSLREAEASFRVVKNRLTLRAADAAGTAEIKDFLTGPTALTLVDGDVALAAKTISKLGGEWELLEYKGGLMDGAALDRDQFVAIAKLPGRDQLNAQFAGIVASPLTGLVRGLGSMVSGLASQLQQIADQGLVTGEAPAAEEAPPADPGSEAEEPAADEASGADAAESSDPDPAPDESPEEGADDQEAPEGEDAGQGAEAEQTGEGDADLGEEPAPAEDTASEQTSGEQSDENESSDSESDETDEKEDGE